MAACSHDRSRAAGGPAPDSAAAAVLLVVGMVGGTTLLVADLLGGEGLTVVGLAVVLGSGLGAGVLTARDARRTGRSFLRAAWASVREVVRWSMRFL